MQIVSFRTDYIPEAVALFLDTLHRQRLIAPMMPEQMEDSARVSAMLEDLFHTCTGVMALDDERLTGYIGWFTVDNFRDTDRQGAYVPAWGHACVEHGKMAIYRALYRAAAEQWAAAGCQVHAITLFAHDHIAEQAWFWSGFGLTGVDAIRPMSPLDVSYPTTVHIRKATPDDAQVLAELDAEHVQHYSRSPIFMPLRVGSSTAEHVLFLSRPNNSIWLALDGAVPAGFMRFDGTDVTGAAIGYTDDAVSITGAYVRASYRGRRIGAALLDAALRDYQARSFPYCLVDFEAFNLEAAAFWTKYFDLVCLSVVRVPEATAPHAGEYR